MSGAEGFLARWSRRKRVSRVRPHEAADAATRAQSTDLPSPPQAPVPDAAIVEPKALPAIGSLDAGADITPFLAPGVPLELTRRALRRAWTADPAIRDFIGLSENAWDFTSPGGVPGFGALTVEDAGRLLARALEPTDATEAVPPPATPAALDAPPNQDAEAGRRAKPADRLARSAQIVPDVAMQQETGEAETHRARPLRSHGGALPK